MSIIAFGGGFDPPHKAHISLIRYIYSTFNRSLNINKILIIPLNYSSNKIPKASIYHRLNMCSLSFSTLDKVEVDNIDILTSGVTLTFNTIQYLYNKFDNEDIYFIVGTDNIKYLSQWEGYSIFSNLCKFIFIERDYNNVSVQNSLYLKLPETYLKNISSSLCRERIKLGYNVSYLLPKSIDRYIKENKLYL